jgi:putative transposase
MYSKVTEEPEGLVDVVRCPIYPSKEQADVLFHNFRICTEVRNTLLDRKNFNSNQLPTLKKEHPEYCDVYSRVFVNLTSELRGNISGLSAAKKKGRRVGHLRHKPVRHLIYNQSWYKITSSKLYFSNIGWIPVVYPGEIRGEIKQLVIKFTKTHKWFVSIVTRIPTPETKLLDTQNVVGIDLNLENFSTDSDGKVFPHPKYLRKSLKQLRRAHRNVSRKKKGSNNRRKAKLRLAIINEAIANRRDDFLHKFSNHYVFKSGYTGIAVEKLNVKDMMENCKMTAVTRAIADSAWARARSYLKYKAGRSGIAYQEIDPSYTSQTCSHCGKVQKIPLVVRTYTCKKCGMVMNRDQNAAINIKNRAFGVGRVQPEFTTGEIGVPTSGANLKQTSVDDSVTHTKCEV